MSNALQVKVNWLDKAIATVAPSWGLNRIRARTLFALASRRNYEAAKIGRRTAGWTRSVADANAASAAASALGMLRAHARDLERNNGWSGNALRILKRSVVGWGIIPKPVRVEEPQLEALRLAWEQWAGTTECDADGLHTFFGLQSLAFRTAVRDGEVLLRRRWRRPTDGLAIPLQLQLLEADYIDTSKDGITGAAGGKIIQGVEHDKLGRRVAYWLYDEHPGSRYVTGLVSRRIPASEVIHLFDVTRAGQVRGVSWFAPAIVNLKDFDEYEDATMMRQKLAALFAAFVTDPNGDPGAVPSAGTPSTTDDRVEEFEPGMIKYLAPGETVEFANPPQVTNDGFSERALRRVAAAIGCTYEDLVGDWSQVNYSSGRMGRLGFWDNVYDWQWNMMVPRFCAPVWAWAMEAAVTVGVVDTAPGAEWTCRPMQMVDPDKEGLALQRLVRAGAMTPSEMVRQQGKDPEAHWNEWAEDLATLDRLGIWLDCDPRRTSAAGLTQARVGASGASSSGDGSSEGSRAAEQPAIVVVNAMPDQAEQLSRQVVAAIEAARAKPRAVTLTRDDKGRVTGASVQES